MVSTHQGARPVNPWLQLATVFGLFLAGGGAGLGLASRAAPGSGLAAAASVMMLPATFAGGLLIWSGLDFVRVLTRAIRRRSTLEQPPKLSSKTGAWFIPLGVTLSAISGIVTGVMPGGWGLMTTVSAYCATGFIYGLLMARLASAGYLPPPRW